MNTLKKWYKGYYWPFIIGMIVGENLEVLVNNPDKWLRTWTDPIEYLYVLIVWVLCWAYLIWSMRKWYRFFPFGKKS